MLSIYRRGRIYWIRGSINGQRIRKHSLDTASREVAYQRMVDLELRGGREPVGWDKFRKQFLESKTALAASSRHKYEFVLNRFEAFLAARGIAQIEVITPDIIAAYSVERQQDKHPRNKHPLGTEGSKSDLRILHSAFEFAVELDYLPKNPVLAKNLKPSRGKTLPFTRDELSRLLSHPYVANTPWRRALVLTFLGTGLRISDISAMLKKSVDLEGDLIQWRTKKRKTDVTLGLHSEVRAALQKHLRAMTPTQRFSPYLFPTRTGKRSWEQSMHSQLVRMFEKAGIKGGHAHRFRDTFAVNMLAGGASLYDVAKQLGITMRVAEDHYAPFVRELQMRVKRLAESLDLTFAPSAVGNSRGAD